MNLSKKVALILGPSLAIVVLFAGYWVKTHQLDAGTPLELHAGVASANGLSTSPSPSAVMDVPVPPVEPPQDSREASAAAPPPVVVPVSPASPQVAVPPAVAPPKFDVVRVEPTGDALIAGHTEPGSQVAVVANGKVIAEGKSDAAGQFVLLPPPLVPGDHALALQVTPPSGPTITSDQNVAISVPVKGKGDVMVALAEPGKPTVLLVDPTAKAESAKTETAPSKEEPKVAAPSSTSPLATTPPATAHPATTPSAKPEVSIKTVEIVEHGGFYATGLAAPNAHLRLYLNGSVLVDVTAGSDGQWAVKIIKGLVPGHYAVRIDQIDKAGAVLARAEVPFDYAAPKPAEVAAAPQQLAPPAAVAPPTPAPSAPASAPLGVKAPERQASMSPPQTHNDASAPSPPANNIAKAETAPPAASPSNVTADAKPSTAVKAADSAIAVVNEIQTTTVERGSNLWRISRGTLGRGIRYTEIYAANSSQIRDPKLIYPGQVFVIPGQTN